MRFKTLEPTTPTLEDLSALPTAEEDSAVLSVLDELCPLQAQRDELEPRYLAMREIVGETPYGMKAERQVSHIEYLTAKAEFPVLKLNYYRLTSSIEDVMARLADAREPPFRSSPRSFMNPTGPKLPCWPSNCCACNDRISAFATWNRRMGRKPVANSLRAHSMTTASPSISA